MHKNIKEDDRENTNNVHKSTREHLHVAGRTAREGRLGETYALCLLPPLAPSTSQHTQTCTLGSVVLVGFTRLCSDFRSRLSMVLRRLSLMRAQKSHISDYVSYIEHYL